MKSINTIIFKTVFLIIVLSLSTYSQLKVAILPFNTIDTLLFSKASASIKSAYPGIKIKVFAKANLPDSAYYKPRNRYRAEKLLAHLDTIIPENYHKIIGVTTKDISATKGKYYDWGIFGYGSIGGKPSVVSTFRLKKKHEAHSLFIQRFNKIMIHELGHTIGFTHCPNLKCIMTDACGKISTIDNANSTLCNSCKNLYKVIMIDY